MASVIITGGGGFLGRCLARELLRRGAVVTEDGPVPLRKLVLADLHFAPDAASSLAASSSNSNHSNNAVEIVARRGDISSREHCDSLFREARDNHHVSVFHLGAVMSGDGERDFDLCLRVNLHGCLNLLEAARQYGSSTNNSSVPKFVLASAGATIGAGAATDHASTTDAISDSTRAAPHTTYGCTKACAELLLADYSRRGFVDGRGVRLPTVIVRAGQPNAATTGCFSAVIREPLAGIDCTELPVAATVQHAVTGHRAAVDGLLQLHDCPRSRIEQTLGCDRTVFLPARAVALGELHRALLNVVDPASHHLLGKVDYRVDEHLSRVVGSFPTRVDAGRARQLGVPPAPDVETMVRDYVQAFGGSRAAVADGLRIVPSPTAAAAAAATAATSMEPQRRIEIGGDNNVKVAVITGAGSGIGRAVAGRLARGGNWAVVLTGRRLETLQETQRQLALRQDDSSSNSNCCAVDSVCVPADVTVESDVERLFAVAEQRYGRVDLLFNNAGVNVASCELPDVTLGDFERVLQTNAVGPFLCARAAMRLMKKTGTGGRIINNGSISAQTPRPGSAPYTVSKHAVTGLTQCVALDGRAHSIAGGQIDFGNVVSEISQRTNQPGQGALQADGRKLEEPFMEMEDAAETVWTMANLPLEANVLHMTVLATGMPFVGRG